MKDRLQNPEGFKFQETYFDFYNYSGIHRPVKLYKTPKKYIKDIVIKTEIKGLNSHYEDKHNVTIKDYNKIYAEGVLPTADKAVVKAEIDATDAITNVKVLDEQGKVIAEKAAEECGGKYCVEIELGNPNLWNPGAAYLYSLRVEGKAGTEPCGWK